MKTISHFFCLGLILFSISALANIKTEKIDYKQGSTALEGFLVYNENLRGGPGVILIHDWMGISDDTKNKAKEMAELGYVAFVADIYGKGTRPQDTKEAGQISSQFKNDRPLLRKRAQAAFDYMKKHPRVNSKKIAAHGYCFGGTTVLEMALSGLPLQGVVSFHGGLDFPTLEKDAAKIKSKILVLHGAIDPWVPAEQVATFTKALDATNKDYQFISYSGAVHAFTNPQAGNDIKTGAAYDPKAEKRANTALKAFYDEVLN